MADPFSAAIGTGAGIIGSLTGYFLGSGDREEQAKLIKQATDQYGNIDVPKLKQLVATKLGPSAYNSISEDPSLKATQQNTLAALKRISDNGGMTLEDQANLNGDLRKSSANAAQNRGAITDNMHSRGVGGSGAEWALQAQAQQAQNERASQEAETAAASSQSRALQALQQQGSLAGQVRGQDYSEASQKASANDAINKYNAQATDNMGQYNNGVLQQGYNDQLGLAGAKAGADYKAAGYYGDQAANMQQLGSGIGQSINQGLNGTSSKGPLSNVWDDIVGA